MENEAVKADEYNAPFVVAMVVCDAIWRDPWTGKCTVIGTFSTITAGTFPALHPILSVYFALTDGRGETEIILRLDDAEGEREPIVEERMPIKWEDPRIVVESVFQINGVVFPEPEEYRLRLFSGTCHLMERRILVGSTG